jgi:uncharacterized protein
MRIAARTSLFVLLALLAVVGTIAADKPLKGLIITGGCCHNYQFQSQAITQAVASVAKVEWTIKQDSRTGTRGEIELYNDPKWAEPFDVVIHNECFADTDNLDYIRKITATHKAGKAAMVIHCAMHTYRAIATDDWREFLGVTSKYHEHMAEYKVKPADAKHPIMAGFPPEWTTPKDELYVIEKFWPTAKPLATSTSERDSKSYPVIWINDYHGARVFGTTFGHSDDTFKDPVFQKLLANGFLWAAGRLK